MNHIPDDFRPSDYFRNPEMLREERRFIRQLRNLEVLTDDGVKRGIEVTPKSLNGVLDLRTRSSSVPASGAGSCPVGTPVPLVETDGPTQWHPDILTTTVWTYYQGSVSWFIRHYAPSYGIGGNFQVFKNGAQIATYVGSGIGEPYDQIQTGFAAASAGDVFLSNAGSHSFTVPLCPPVTNEFPDPTHPDNAAETDCEACINSIIVDDVTGDVLTDDVTHKVLTNT